MRDYLLKTQFSLPNLLDRIHATLNNPDPAKGDDRPPECTTLGIKGAPEDVGDVCNARTSGTCIAHRLDTTALSNLRPIIARSDLYDRLDNCGELRALSPSVSQILKLTGQPNCAIDTLAKVVKQDQAIALKILKLANSTVYTRGEPVDTVAKAIMRVGINQLRQMVLNLSVVDRFSSCEADERLNSLDFWEHSIAVGLIAAELTRSLEADDEEIDAAFTMGLLHDVGRMVLAELFGEQYRNVLDAAKQTGAPLEQVEKRMLLVTHADAMDRVLHAWNFPKALINPIVFHHLSIGNVRRMSPRCLKEVATLGLANRLAHTMLLGTSGNDVIYPFEEHAQALNIKEQIIDQIAEIVPAHTTDIKFAMLSRSDAGGAPSTLERARARLSEPLRPLCASVQPQFDAVRLVCDRLAAKDGAAEAANVIFARIAHSRERAAVSQIVKRLEADVGASDLPVVVFSPTGDLSLEGSAASRSMTQLLPFPVSLDAVIDAANAAICPGSLQESAVRR